MRSVLALLALVLVGLGVTACCRAETASSCKRSVGCTVNGICGIRTFRAGEGFAVCIADSEPACASSSDCKAQGLCHLDPTFTPSRCVAKTSADCLGSQGCATDGRCTLGDDGTCITSTAGCTRSPALRAAQRTRPTHQPLLGVRRPGSYLTGTVAPSGTCETGPAGCAAACREEGACTNKGGECLASTDADCRASMVCTRNGRCTVDPSTHTCVARADTDCAASDVCLRGGRDRLSYQDTRTCQTRAGVDACSTDLCARTQNCALRGECVAVAGICLPTEPAHCANSRDCKVRGLCSYRDYTCYASSQTDCDVSYECRTMGRCKLTPSPLSRIAFCDDPAVGRDGKHCVTADCWKDDTCVLAKTGACVTPASVGLPPLLPPEPPRALRMQGGIDERTVVLTHALARRVSADSNRIVTDIRLGARPFDCTVFENPGPPTFRLRTEISTIREGYAMSRGAVGSVQWSENPPFPESFSARFEATPTLGITPTLIEIDLDTNALPGRTLSVHGDLIAQPCPP